MLVLPLTVPTQPTMLNMLTVLLIQLVAGLGPPQTFSSTSPMFPPTLDIAMHTRLSTADLIRNRFSTTAILVVPGSRVSYIQKFS